MEIGQFGARPNLSSRNELWSLVKAKREALKERQEALEFVEQQLGNLLLGQELDPAQQSAYVRRLVGTAAQAAELAEGPDIVSDKRFRIAREELLLRVGGVSWRPFPVSRRAVVVTPLHRRLQNRMALALKNQKLASPMSIRTSVYAVGINIDLGHSVVSSGSFDSVDLSGWGRQVLSAEQAFEKPLNLPPTPVFMMQTVGPSAPSF